MIDLLDGFIDFIKKIKVPENDKLPKYIKTQKRVYTYLNSILKLKYTYKPSKLKNVKYDSESLSQNVFISNPNPNAFKKASEVYKLTNLV